MCCDKNGFPPGGSCTVGTGCSPTTITAATDVNITPAGNLNATPTGDITLAPTGRLFLDQPLRSHGLLQLAQNLFLNSAASITGCVQIDNAGGGIQVGNNEVVTLSPTGGVALNANGGKITNVADGAAVTDGATVGQAFQSFGGSAPAIAPGAYNANGSSAIGAGGVVLTRNRTLQNLFCVIDSAVTLGTLTLEIFVNGAGTGITVTFNNASPTTLSDTTHTFVCAPGDVLTMNETNGVGLAGPTIVSWGFEAGQ